MKRTEDKSTMHLTFHPKEEEEPVTAAEPSTNAMDQIQTVQTEMLIRSARTNTELLPAESTPKDEIALEDNGLVESKAHAEKKMREFEPELLHYGISINSDLSLQYGNSCSNDKDFIVRHDHDHIFEQILDITAQYFSWRWIWEGPDKSMPLPDIEMMFGRRYLFMKQLGREKGLKEFTDGKETGRTWWPGKGWE
jgi:hypothetical protein